MLNLKHLYYFHVFAHQLNTAEAARKLGISSPALSNQLKELEIYIEAKLTNRSTGKVEITETGEIVLHYADQMFSIYDKLETELLDLKDFKNTNFRIGISPDIGARFSFDIISLIEKTHATLHQKMFLTFESSEKLLFDFKKEKYDLIIGAFGPCFAEKSNCIFESLNFPVNLFAPAHLKAKFMDKFENLHKAPLRSLIEFANEMNLSWVIPMGHSTFREETNRCMSDSEIAPARTVECNTSWAAVQLIERGLAMGFLPTPILLDFKSANLLTVLGPPKGYWTYQISIIASKQEDLPKAEITSLSEFFGEN